MVTPTFDSVLAELPPSLRAIPYAESTGLRRLIFRAVSPAGQCFGSTMVIADGLWEEAKRGANTWAFRATVRHETRHYHQSHGWRLPFFVLGYLLFPLPIGFSFRALFELGGYRESLRCYEDELIARGSWSMSAVQREAERLAGYFRARWYGWMGWLLPTRLWVWALMKGLP